MIAVAAEDCDLSKGLLAVIIGIISRTFRDCCITKFTAKIKSINQRPRRTNDKLLLPGGYCDRSCR